MLTIQSYYILQESRTSVSLTRILQFHEDLVEEGLRRDRSMLKQICKVWLHTKTVHNPISPTNIADQVRISRQTHLLKLLTALIQPTFPYFAPKPPIIPKG